MLLCVLVRAAAAPPAAAPPAAAVGDVCRCDGAQCTPVLTCARTKPSMHTATHAYMLQSTYNQAYAALMDWFELQSRPPSGGGYQTGSMLGLCVDDCRNVSTSTFSSRGPRSTFYGKRSTGTCCVCECRVFFYTAQKALPLLLRCGFPHPAAPRTTQYTLPALSLCCSCRCGSRGRHERRRLLQQRQQQR